MATGTNALQQATDSEQCDGSKKILPCYEDCERHRYACQNSWHYWKITAAPCLWEISVKTQL